MAVKYDTVVIGAGPSGSACGITLQRRGIKNCLIDKAVFPRHKTCAGLVTGKTYKLINKLFGEDDTAGLFCDTTSRIRLFQRKRELVTAQSAYGEVRIKRSRGFGVMREKAEYEDLARLARENGVSLRDVKNSIEA